jgi:hypothetical protein
VRLPPSKIKKANKNNMIEMLDKMGNHFETTKAELLSSGIEIALSMEKQIKII